MESIRFDDIDINPMEIEKRNNFIDLFEINSSKKNSSLSSTSKLNNESDETFFEKLNVDFENDMHNGELMPSKKTYGRKSMKDDKSRYHKNMHGNKSKQRKSKSKTILEYTVNDKDENQVSKIINKNHYAGSSDNNNSSDVKKENTKLFFDLDDIMEDSRSSFPAHTETIDNDPFAFDDFSVSFPFLDATTSDDKKPDLVCFDYTCDAKRQTQEVKDKANNSTPTEMQKNETKGPDIARELLKEEIPDDLNAHDSDLSGYSVNGDDNEPVDDDFTTGGDESDSGNDLDVENQSGKEFSRPTFGMLDKFTNQTLLLREARKVGAWAFLVVIDSTNPKTWFFPLRIADGRISRPLLAEARSELSSGTKGVNRSKKFGLVSDTLAKFERICNRAMPGTPRLVLASCYANCIYKYGNPEWLDSSQDLHDDTRAVLADIQETIDSSEDECIANEEYEARINIRQKELESILKEREEEHQKIVEKRKKDTLGLIERMRSKRKDALSGMSEAMFQKPVNEFRSGAETVKKSTQKNYESIKKGDNIFFLLPDDPSDENVRRPVNDSVNQRILGKTGNLSSSEAIETAKICEHNRTKMLRTELLDQARRKLANVNAMKYGFKNLDNQISFETNILRTSRMNTDDSSDENSATEMMNESTVHSESENGDSELTTDVNIAGSPLEPEKHVLKASVDFSSEVSEDSKKLSDTSKVDISLDLSVTNKNETDNDIGIVKAPSLHVSIDTTNEKVEGDFSAEKTYQELNEEKISDGMTAENIDSELSSSEKSKQKNRNLSYRYMLERENEQVRKLMKADVVEHEASEEESDDELDDYGNSESLKRKQRSINDDIDIRMDRAQLTMTEDDLSAVVDEISDNEGEGGGDVGELFRDEENVRYDEELARLKEDVQKHRLVSETLRRRRPGGRFSKVLGDDSGSDSDTDEEEELAREERYRTIDEHRRKAAIESQSNGNENVETLEEVEAEVRDQAIFLKLSMLESKKRRALKRSQRKLSRKLQRAGLEERPDELINFDGDKNPKELRTDTFAVGMSETTIPTSVDCSEWTENVDICVRQVQSTGKSAHYNSNIVLSHEGRNTTIERSQKQEKLVVAPTNVISAGFKTSALKRGFMQSKRGKPLSFVNSSTFAVSDKVAKVSCFTQDNASLTGYMYNHKKKTVTKSTTNRDLRNEVDEMAVETSMKKNVITQGYRQKRKGKERGLLGSMLI